MDTILARMLSHSEPVRRRLAATARLTSERKARGRARRLDEAAGERRRSWPKCKEAAQA
jgi:hypothetical protein